MSILLFAILETGNARSEFGLPRRNLIRAQTAYDQAERRAAARSTSITPGVSQRANAVLTLRLDTLDACRAEYDTALERIRVAVQAEKEASALAQRAWILTETEEDNRQLNQYRNAHA